MQSQTLAPSHTLATTHALADQQAIIRLRRALMVVLNTFPQSAAALYDACTVDLTPIWHGDQIIGLGAPTNTGGHVTMTIDGGKDALMISVQPVAGDRPHITQLRAPLPAHMLLPTNPERLPE